MATQAHTSPSGSGREDATNVVQGWKPQRDILQKLWKLPQTLSTMSEGMVWEVLQDAKLDKELGGEGWNIKSQEAKKGDKEDERLLAYIRWVNLDILWSKSKNTV
eukprot:10232310-Ditylum_brightwellii.AAC.1